MCGERGREREKRRDGEREDLRGVRVSEWREIKRTEGMKPRRGGV